MKVLEYLRARPAIAVGITVAAIAILALTLFVTRETRVRNPGAKEAVFFDEASNTLVLRPSTEVPPLTNSEGKPGIVRAVMTVPDTTNLKNENIQYLYRFTPEAQKTLQDRINSVQEVDINAMLQWELAGKEVRLPQAGSPWVSVETPQGQRIAGLQ